MAAVQPHPQSAAPESGDLYRLIADTIPHMVWAARADGWVDFFNQRFQAYSGLDKSQLEGWGWEAVVHPEDLHRCLEVWRRVLDTAERYEIECRIRRADGAYRWHQIIAVPTVGADGDVQRWFGTCTDIDAEVRTAESLERMVQERTEALRKSEARFRSLTLLTADSYWEQDEQYRFTSFITSGAVRSHGLGERVRVGTRRWENGYVNMTQADWEHHRAVLDAREPFYELELCRVMEDGSKLWVSTSGEPVFDASGAFKGYRGVGRDITARKRDEAMLKLEHAVTQHLAAADSQSSALRDVIRELCQSESFECGRYFRFDEAAGLLRFAEAWGIPEPEVERFIAASRDVTYLISQGITGRVWQSGEPLWVANRGEHAGLAYSIFGQSPDLFLFSLRSNGKTFGVLSFFSRKIRAPDHRLLQAVRIIGSQVGQFLQRKHAEQVLHESQRRFHLFIDNSPSVAWIKDSRLRYTHLSKSYESKARRSSAEFLGKDDFAVWPSVARQLRENDERVLRTGAPIQAVESMPGPGGALRYSLVIKFPLPDGTGALGVAGMGIDISERVEAEKLVKRYAEDVRMLLDRLVTAQESERLRIADGLHDLIGQNLTALGIELSALKQALPAERHEPRFEAMAALLGITIEAIRGVMTELRPPELEEFGLLPALRSYGAQFSQRTGMKVSTNVAGPPPQLKRDTALALFRIVQEALTNAAKHSGASKVEISMTNGGGRIRLCVEDDGRGFADRVGARRDHRGGWGLPAMRERAQAHGGELHIEFPGRGTRLIVELPAGNAD